MFFWDSTMLLLIPAMLLAFYAQMKVSRTFKKFSEVRNARNLSGYETAMNLLKLNDIRDVKVEETPGHLSDHYDPRDKTVRLSTDNFRGSSISSVAVAAHEVGHAIQHAVGYAPLNFRHAILPVANIGSWLPFPLLMIGFIFQSGFLIDIGILIFAGAVLFHIVTLPVEFNASSRALGQLASHGFLASEETGNAKKVLDAAALTYVAAAAVSVTHLIRLLILRGSFSND